MAIKKKDRDRLLVEARHRCTICSEKCFEIHHIVEQADGGSDEEENLIVLCPNCHQHRYHRCGEFTRDQLRLYKAKLKEANEIERRLLLNLEEVKAKIGELPSAEIERQLQSELSQAAQLVNPDHSTMLHRTLIETANDLAKNKDLPKAARQAIELKFEAERQQVKAQFPQIEIVKVDEDAYCKSNKFPAAYKFVLIINREPHYDWVEVFNQKYKNSWYSMKRETRILGNRIEMIVADSDNLQNHLNFAKKLVEETNKFVQSEGFLHIDIQINLAKAKALEEFDKIQSMKERTKSLRI